MTSSVIDWMDDVVSAVDKLRPSRGRVVFVSGNFNIVHPGHLRLLNFATECGDLLLVGVVADDLAQGHLPQHLRLEGVRSIGIVDYPFILHAPADVVIRVLKPHVFVKGKGHDLSTLIRKP